jgi:hypothetical protein
MLAQQTRRPGMPKRPRRWPRMRTFRSSVSRVTRLALDDVMLADVECQPDNAAVAVIAGHSWE